MSYTAQGNIEVCYNNDKAFIYRLIRVNEIIDDWHAIDLEVDTCYLNSDTKYIGLTSNPIKRAQYHRTSKGKDLVMQIFRIANTPAMAKYFEAEAIYFFEEKFGEVPEFQKGGDTFAGA
jgi:hypothetical protein